MQAEHKREEDRPDAAEESDEDDSYFDAMVAAAEHEEDNTSQAGSRAVSRDRGFSLNDEEYYRGMMELGTTSSSVQEESNDVWLKIISDLAATTNRPGEIVEVDRTSYTQMQCVKQWLYQFLPHASASYCTVCRLMESDFDGSSFKVFVDSLPHPTAAAVVEAKNHTDASIYAWGEIPTAVANLCAIAAQGYKRLTMGATEASLEAEVKRSLSRAGFHFKISELCSLFVLDGAKMPSEDPAAGLDSCYTISPLEHADAPLVNSTWKYRNDSSLQLMESMIATMPCFGVRYSNGDTSELVAWCLTYKNGYIGVLYTMEDHRRKGLARAIAKKLIQAFGDTTAARFPGVAPFCFIENANEASQALFHSFNFTRLGEQSWHIFGTSAQGDKENYTISP